MSKIATYKIEGYIGPFEPDFMKPGDKFTTSDMLSEFIESNKEAAKLIIEIDSNGGSTTHGFKMYDLLKTSGKEIETVGWNVKSIATAPFLAGIVRKIAEHGEFLIHNPWINPQNLGWSLTADEAFRVAEDIKAEEDKLFNFYVDKINAKGKDAKILRSYMSKNINMPITDVVEWGFATEVIGATANVFKSAPVFAYAESMNLKQYKKDTMAEDKKAAKTAWDKLMGGFNQFATTMGIIKKAAVVTLEDGTTKLYINGDLAEGSEVWLDEAYTTVATDGDFVLDTGETITIKGGKISTIVAIDPAAETVEALKAKVAELTKQAGLDKTKYEALVAEKTALETKNAEIMAQVTTMGTALAEFESKHFSAEKKVIAPVVQAFSKEKEEKTRFPQLRNKLKTV